VVYAGAQQTAQRAECWSLLQGLCGCDGLVRVVMDSVYLCGMVVKLFGRFAVLARARSVLGAAGDDGHAGPAGRPDRPGLPHWRSEGPWAVGL